MLQTSASIFNGLFQIICGLQAKAEEKLFSKNKRNLPGGTRAAGLTEGFLEAEADEGDQEDDEELTATERAPTSLRRRGLAAEQEVWR